MHWLSTNRAADFIKIGDYNSNWLRVNEQLSPVDHLKIAISDHGYPCRITCHQSRRYCCAWILGRGTDQGCLNAGTEPAYADKPKAIAAHGTFTAIEMTETAFPPASGNEIYYWLFFSRAFLLDQLVHDLDHPFM